MIIRKFNESVVNEDISDYFLDLTDSGDWTVKIVDKSNDLDHWKIIYITSPEIQKWYKKENSIFLNWGMSADLEMLEKDLEIRTSQVNNWSLILKCMSHFTLSIGYKITMIEHKSIGTKSTGPLYPVDTIVFSIEEL